MWQSGRENYHIPSRTGFFLEREEQSPFPFYGCIYMYICLYRCRSQWPRGLRRRSAAARLLKSWVRNPPGAWMFVCCECCVLCGWRSLRRANHSSRVVLSTEVRRCVWSRNLVNEEAMAHWGLLRQKQTNNLYIIPENPQSIAPSSADYKQLCTFKEPHPKCGYEAWT